MGNPVITRLGKTQMWYKNWYTNFYLPKTLKTVHSFQKLIQNYFSYGILLNNNLFIHSFFYKTNLLNNNQYIKDINMSKGFKNRLYFRKYYFFHKILSIEHSYFIRLSTPEYFPLKLYLIRFKGWVVVSVQWFKPLKKTLDNGSFFSKKTHSIISGNIFSKKKTPLNKKHSRFLLSVFLLKTKKPGLNYFF